MARLSWNGTDSNALTNTISISDTSPVSEKQYPRCTQPPYITVQPKSTDWGSIRVGTLRAASVNTTTANERKSETIYLSFIIPLRSVVRSQRLLQRKRSLPCNSAYSALFA